MREFILNVSSFGSSFNICDKKVLGQPASKLIMVAFWKTHWHMLRCWLGVCNYLWHK